MIQEKTIYTKNTVRKYIPMARVIVGFLVFAVIRIYRKIHDIIAKQPHAWLQKRWSWYAQWHKKSYYAYINKSVALVAVTLVLSVMISQYRNVLALSDTFKTWDFSQLADYETSSGAEISGTNAQLKVNEYAPDANTKALYHLNESSGSVADDAASNNLNGTASNVTFGNGNLNNSAGFNGTSSSIRVGADSNLALSQNQTIEAWTKLNNSSSPGSIDHRQGIVASGNYQLYYDNETGRVTYEIADKAATDWSQAAGNGIKDSWDLNGKQSVNVLSSYGGGIAAGTGFAIGDAEVWLWKDSAWTKIGGDGIKGSWGGGTYENVHALTAIGGTLYAGLGTSTADGEVWAYDGSAWTKIGGDSLNGGWTNYVEGVYSLEAAGGTLYAGLGASTNDAEVWAWNGSSWSKVGGDGVGSSWSASFTTVYALTSSGNDIYAGVGGAAGKAEVWKLHLGTWTRIGYSGGAWGVEIENVQSLRMFDGILYAGLGASASDADVWAYDGSNWSKIGGDGVNGSWPAGYEQVTAFAWDGTSLYAGLGNSNGDGETWKYTSGAWTKIGGDGTRGSWSATQGDTVNTLLYDGGKLYAGTYDSAGAGLAYTYESGAWTQIGGDYVNKSWGFYGISSVQVMQQAGEYLYAGLGNTAGSALIWRYDGSKWELIGGQGVNGSWAPNTIEQVMSMSSYGGKLVVGTGTTAGDADIWQWDGTTWTQIGGDGTQSSWGAGYEEVDSLASFGGNLYAGLGSSAGDSEVWRYNGTSWTKIGGDNINSGWNTYAENVRSLGVYNNQLIAGLGRTTGDAELWKWNGSSWTQIGGDSVAGSWSATENSEVTSMIAYNGKLVAGLGGVAGDADIWQYDGSSWTQIGGDEMSGSWTIGTYERIQTITEYNGYLYAGLGNGAEHGEVWRLENSDWVRVAGNGVNSGWTNAIEEVDAFSVYQGKLYAGLGRTANVDGSVWSFGNNGYLTSAESSFDTSWRHIAATYDGTKMKLFINGVESNHLNTVQLLPTTQKDLLIGATYGGREQGKPAGNFDGSIDEVRISDVARTNFVSKPYSSQSQTVQPTTAVNKNGIWHWDEFTASESGGGTITYRLSDDDGATWKYWNGSTWATSSSVSQANAGTDINSHISTFPVTFDGLLWQAVLQGDGDQRPVIDSVDLKATKDNSRPSASGVTVNTLLSNGGTQLADNAWTNSNALYHSWNAGSDGQSGIKGYCLYFGPDNTADLSTTKGILGESPLNPGDNCKFAVASTNLDFAANNILATTMTTGPDPYYLVVKTLDKAGNISSDSAISRIRFDNTAPKNPSFISAPSGFINVKDVTLSWATTGPSAPTDADSGLVGLQYKIGENGTWYGDDHTGTGSIDDVLQNTGAYKTKPNPDYDNLVDGINTVYFRTWDNAGNVSISYATAAIKLNTSGAPSEPLSLSVTPPANTTNAFAFDWDAPTTYVGSKNSITYCYSVNAVPNQTNCVYTPAGVTSLGSGPYALRPGVNTFYVTARDESGNINYDNYSSINFSANTAAPGLPVNSDIVDVSIKATENWRLALTWDAPAAGANSVARYEVYRSNDNGAYAMVGSSSSTTYIDAGISQKTYSYKVRACDNTSNCGGYGTVVKATPTGRFTNPAELISQPEVSDITTKHAVIKWVTDRTSDSKISFGTKSGVYSASELSNSVQTSAHEIKVDNLAAGTTYYFVARWTDEDGNTGSSQEFTFRTLPPPTIKEASAKNISLSGATIQFTSKNATKVGLYYGPSESFGGRKEVNTSFTESTYTINLDELADSTKYFYKLISYDGEDNAYESSVSSFVTPARPRVTNVRFQPVKGQPTSTQQVTWTTNIPSTSALSYGLANDEATESRDSKMVTDHSIEIGGLQDDSEYFLYAQSRDANGNLAISDRQLFRTALDTRPPTVRDITVESSIKGSGAEAKGQVVVSWSTDEPATSQVAFGEGSGVAVFNTKTAEDQSRSLEHVVIVSGLPTSKVYSIMPISHDKTGNEGDGKVQTAIIGRASDDVLTVVINSLRKVFGF